MAGANARASAAWRPALRWLVDSPHWPSLRHMAQLRLFGRALFSPLLRLGRSYDEVAKKWPQATALVTTTLKTSAADAFAQLVRWRDGVGVFWRAVHGCHPGSRHVTSQDFLAVSFAVLTTSNG